MVQDRIRQALLRHAGLDEEQISAVVTAELDGDQSIDQILVSKSFMTEDKVMQFFGEFLGLEVALDLEGVGVPSDFINNVPVQFARTHGLVALGQEGNLVRVATHRPLDVQPMDDLAAMMGTEVEAVLCPRQEIANLINRAYRHKADGVDEALVDIEEQDILGLADQVEESEDLLSVANKAPIIKLVNMLLFQALKLRASDIHLQPFQNRLQVRMRVDGVLYDTESIPRKAQDAIISRVKVMGKMDIAERRLPQDGRASIRIGDGDVDVRISTIPVQNGERVVFRILDKTTKVFTIDQIGLSEENQTTINRYLHYSHGVILVTGPTGSGKTTTLYAGLDAINSKSLNILTIEDPVEYNLDGVSQVQVNTKKGLTFAAGLRSFLRQDPDVMMVGEIRDNETADIAIRAALTGHLVFSTVHTNDSASTVTRMLDIGVEPYLVSSSILLVVAQRLVRTVCPHCKERVNPDQSILYQLEDLKIELSQFEDEKILVGKGCDECFKSGFSGRTAIYEIMPIDAIIQEQIIDKASASAIKRGAIQRGLRTLRMDGVDKLLDGLTTPEEILRVTQLDIA
jgi:general secretion pathway protein E